MGEEGGAGLKAVVVLGMGALKGGGGVSGKLPPTGWLAGKLGTPCP